MWFWIGERYLRLFRKICKIALLRGENFFLQIGHIGCQNIRNFILISKMISWKLKMAETAENGWKWLKMLKMAVNAENGWKCWKIIFENLLEIWRSMCTYSQTYTYTHTETYSYTVHICGESAKNCWQMLKMLKIISYLPAFSAIFSISAIW